MSDRKQLNYYYPPEWTPSKGSLNKMLHQHPLRDRARKLDQGILIIRFEAPFNMWCLGCNKHIAKGVRFNAEKKAIGSYYTTKIWQFAMKCAGCSHKIVINTDPKNCEYVCVEGARQKDENFTAAQTELVEFLTSEEKDKMSEDKLFRLEHMEEGRRIAAEQGKLLKEVFLLNERKKDDFSMSQKMRKTHREKRHASSKLIREAKSHGLALPLLGTSEEDSAIAGTKKFDSKASFDTSKRVKFAKILSSPLYSPDSNSRLAKRAQLMATRAKLGFKPRIKQSPTKHSHSFFSKS